MKTFLLLLFSFPLLCYSQKLTVNETDKFTGKKRLETSYCIVTMKFVSAIQMKLRSVDTTCFVTFNGNTGVGVVGLTDATTFLFEDNSTTKVYPTSIQSYDIGVGQYSSNTFNQQYNISIDQIEMLKTKKLISIRREFNSNYADFDVKEKHAEKISKLCMLFLSELKKATL